MVVARFLSIPKPGYPVKAADNLLFQHVRQKLKVTFLLGCFTMSHAMKKDFIYNVTQGCSIYIFDIPKISVLDSKSVYWYDIFTNTDVPKFPIYGVFYAKGLKFFSNSFDTSSH